MPITGWTFDHIDEPERKSGCSLHHVKEGLNVCPESALMSQGQWAMPSPAMETGANNVGGT